MLINVWKIILKPSWRPKHGSTYYGCSWYTSSGRYTYWVVGIADAIMLWNHRQLFQLTHDHSLVQSLVDEGSITKKKAFDHPRRNIIQQNLGMHEAILPTKVFSSSRQKLIFCSDGLNSMVRDNEILSICDSDIPITEVVTNLIAAANGRWARSAFLGW